MSFVLAESQQLPAVSSKKIPPISDFQQRPAVSSKEIPPISDFQQLPAVSSKEIPPILEFQQLPAVSSKEIPPIPEFQQHPAAFTIMQSPQVESSIARHPYLTSIGLVVNTCLRCLICESCQLAITPDQAQPHLSHSHVSAHIHIDVKLFRTAVEIMEVLPTLPATPTSGVFPEVEGLKLSKGLGCDFCRKPFSEPSGMYKHHALYHSNQPIPRVWRTAFFQQFHPKFSRTLFEVEPRTSLRPTTVDHLITQLEDSLAEMTHESGPIKRRPRMISPWLKTTKWHEHIAPYDIMELKALVMPPKKNELPGLVILVNDYFSKASDLIESTDELVLQYLNSPDPAKHGVNNRPFHRHQEESTLGQYMSPIISLLTMLLRQKTTYVIALDTITHKALIDLQEILPPVDQQEALQCIHKVFTSLWMQTWSPTMHDSMPDPTLRSLALLGLKIDGGHKEASENTSTIAKFEYCLRLCSLWEMHNLMQGPLALTADEARRRVQVWFVEKTYSPFNSLRSLQHRASALTYATMSMPRIWWTDRVNWTSMLYRGNPVSLEQMRQIFKCMEETTIHHWENNVLCGLELHIPYGPMTDDPSNMDVGYSFLVDPRNTSLAASGTMIKAILANESTRKHFFILNAQGKKLVWNIPAARTWLNQYTTHNGHMLTRTEMLSGGPGRSTELAALNYLNTETRPTRNMHMLGDHLSVSRLYSKVSALTNQDRRIPHSIDAVTKDIMILDLSFVRPFANLVVKACFPGASEAHAMYKENLFVHDIREPTATDLSNVIGHFSLPILGFSMNVSSWRHIYVGFERKLCGQMTSLVEDGQQDTIQALQLGHNRQSHDRIYGISADALAGPAEDVMPLFLDASVSWQMLVRVVPGGLRLHYKEATMSHFDDLVDKGIISLPGNNTSTGLDLDLIANKVSSRLRDTFSQLVKSTMMNGSLSSGMLQTGLNQVGELTSTITTLSRTHLESPIQADVTLEEKALAMLRQLIHDPKGQWTYDQQCDAVLAALHHNTDVLAIIKTGGGKSMIPIIPAMLEDRQTTVIVLPLKSLLLDYDTKLKGMSVPFEHYCKENLRLRGQHNLVLVSADYAMSLHFREALAIINESRPVIRICFDEGHFAFTEGFRQWALGQLHELRQFQDAQLIVLSATIPEVSVPSLMEAFGLLKNTAIYRTGTSRPEIKYVLEPMRTKAAIYERVGQILQEEQPALKQNDRVLVFVTYTEDGRNLAAQLNCDFYSGDSSTTDEQRLEMYHRWRKGVNIVMVATSAFGAGNDYSHVRATVHAGNPYDMMSYTQEKSRAGRDKCPARSYILPRKLSDTSTLPTPTGPIDHKGVIPMQEWLHKSGDRLCSRYVITSFCDGEEEAVTCSVDPKAEWCLVCEHMHGKKDRPVIIPTANPPQKRSANDLSPFADAHQAVKRRKVQVNDASDQYVATMLQALQSSHGHCAFCAVMGVQHPQAHQIIQCPSLSLAKSTVNAYLTWRKDLYYEFTLFKGNICYKCHVPQLNDRLHPTYGARPCDYPDILAPTTFGIFHRYAHLASIHFGAQWSTLADFTVWLNSKPKVGSQSNMSDLFLWYHRTKPIRDL